MSESNPVTPKRRPPPGKLPYTYASAVEEIERWIDSQPRGTHKRLALAAGIDSQSLSHRMAEYQNQRLTVEMFAAIAVEAGAPLGTPWPFCTWREAEALAAIRKMLSADDRD